MSDVLSFAIFLLTACIPTIAIVGELHHETPSSVWYSSVRSIICMGALLFMSTIINPAYKPLLSHFWIVLFIFGVSCIQLYLELHDKSISDIIDKIRHQRKLH